MAYMRVVFSSASKLDGQMKAVVRELAEIEAQLREIQRRLPSEVGARYQISRRLENCRASTDRVRAGAVSLMDTVSGGMENYRRAEAKLQREAAEALAASPEL